MFTTKSNKGNRERHSPPSIIASDCIVTGDVFSQGEVQMDGRVNGDLRCDLLVVGETGSITGEISAQTVRIFGSVNGQITAAAVELAKSARVLGDITHDSLAIEAGAHVQGRIKRNNEEDGYPSESVQALPDRNAGGQALLTAGTEGKSGSAQ